MTPEDVKSVSALAKEKEDAGELLVMCPKEAQWLCSAAKLLEDIALEQGESKDILLALNSPWIPVFSEDMNWPLGKNGKMFWRHRSNHNLVAVLYLKPVTSGKPFVATYLRVPGGVQEGDNLPPESLPPHPEA